MIKSDKAFAVGNIPPVIFGTSGLGNLYVKLDDATKTEIVKQCITHTRGKVVFDSAGKYGAGLALESLGRSLRSLGVKQGDVIISNKLGWYRTELKTAEPTFEPGVWKGLTHDAVQKISFDGMLECFAQGNKILHGYQPQWVSVHDPDEYLAAAASEAAKTERFQHILEAYRALHWLKAQGAVEAVGVGSKDWKTIQRIAAAVELDWVMFANSMTIYDHAEDLVQFIKALDAKGVYVINSAVFHSGFLIGGDYFDYKKLQPANQAHKAIFQWRDDFFAVCKQFEVKPSDACVQFALAVPGIQSLALNTSSPERVKSNIDSVANHIPLEFWEALHHLGLIRKMYQHEL